MNAAGTLDSCVQDQSERTVAIILARTDAPEQREDPRLPLPWSSAEEGGRNTHNRVTDLAPLGSPFPSYDWAWTCAAARAEKGPIPRTGDPRNEPLSCTTR